MQAGFLAMPKGGWPSRCCLAGRQQDVEGRTASVALPDAPSQRLEWVGSACGRLKRSLAAFDWGSLHR